MDKLKINSKEARKEQGYISNPAVLFAKDMNDAPQYRGIDYVNLETIDNQLHVAIGDPYNVKYYPIQEESDLRIDEARGTLTFSSYGNIYIVRAFQDTDGMWASLTNQKVPAKALEEIYMAQATSAFTPDAPAVDDVLYAAVDGDAKEVRYLIYSSAAGMYVRSNRGWFKLPVDDDSIDGLEVWPVSPEFTAMFDKAEAKEETITSSDLKKYSEPDEEALTAAASVEGNCPEATQDIAINLENRGHAIKVAKYGPMNPNEPNDEFWQQKSENFGATVEEAKTSLCGNCVMFIRTPSMLNCISTGLQEGDSSSTNAWDAIDAAELGYCEAFDFKCASSRTCDAWVVGGPITQEDE